MADKAVVGSDSVRNNSSDVNNSKKVALDEDTFTENMSKIIRRDFFPDIDKMEMQLEYFKASEEGDYMKMRDLSARLATTTRTPANNQLATPSASVGSTPIAGTKRDLGGETQSGEELPSMKKPLDVRLDDYLSKYHSEDDASFDHLVEKASQKHREKFAWLYEQEERGKQYAIDFASEDDGESNGQQLAITGGNQVMLAITDGSDQHLQEDNSKETTDQKATAAPKAEVGREIKSWKYTAKNSLMYIPDGVELSAEEKLALPGANREICHPSTRLSKTFIDQLNNFKGQQPEDDKSKTTNLKIGVDGNLLEGDDSPKINGYGFVSTPLIQPGVDASPMMTWGKVDGTPIQLDIGNTPLPTGGQTFKMPKQPKRETLGMRLSERAGKAYTDRRKKALERATTSLLKSSPSLRNALRTPSSERMKLLSPAAQKLAQKATPMRSIDRSLRSAYNTPARRSAAASPSVKSTPSGQSSQAKKGLGRTPVSQKPLSRPTTPLLSDNLLNFKS